MLKSRRPLWVKSRHWAMSSRCPLYPQKQTFVSATGMSALCQKRKSPLRFARRLTRAAVRQAPNIFSMARSFYAAIGSGSFPSRK
jgi:hypothetical protein